MTPGHIRVCKVLIYKPFNHGREKRREEGRKEGKEGRRKGGRLFIRKSILQVRNLVKRSQNLAIVVLEPVRGRADPNPCSCESQAGVPSRALFWESKMREQRGSRPGLGEGPRAVGQRWADEDLERAGGGVSGRPLREGGRVPSSTLLSRASTISQSEVLGFLPVGKSKLLHLSPEA